MRMSRQAMKKRQDTKTVDIEKLYEVLEFMAALTSAAFLVQPCAALNSQMKRDGCAASEEKARSPTGLLTVQIGKMECGQFVGKIKPDKDVERMASNLGSAPFTSPDLWVPGRHGCFHDGSWQHQGFFSAFFLDHLGARSAVGLSLSHLARSLLMLIALKFHSPGMEFFQPWGSFSLRIIMHQLASCPTAPGQPAQGKFKLDDPVTSRLTELKASGWLSVADRLIYM